MLLRICFALFVAAGAWAQQTHAATPPQDKDGPVTRSSFSAKGLQHEEDLTDFFVGNFADVPFDRTSANFAALFEQYMEAYGKHCDAYLPANKVEMTRQECADGYRPPRAGDLPGTDSCSNWRTVSLGYADPALYAAKVQLDHEQAANHVQGVLGAFVNGTLMSSAKDVLQLTADMDGLVRLNACGGVGLRRFQENVVLFSKGKPPILLPGASPPVTRSVQPPGVLADSNYNRLVEDLVADRAKTWAFDRYVPGSTFDVIVAHDPSGRTEKILAKYFFRAAGRSDRTQGRVTVGFSDGMPECIYFSDAPSACQAPSRRIIAKYSSGDYRDASALPSDSSRAAAEPLQPAADRGASAQPPRTVTRRSTNLVAPAPAASTTSAPPPTLEQRLQQGDAGREMRAQKATACRQQAVKDNPQDRAAMAQEYASCLQSR